MTIDELVDRVEDAISALQRCADALDKMAAVAERREAETARLLTMQQQLVDKVGA